MPESSTENLPENTGTTDENSISPDSSGGGNEGGKQTPETMVDRFKAVIDQSQEGGTAPGSSEAEVEKVSGQQPGGKKPASEKPEDELTDVELKLLNPKTQRRIQTLLKQRNDARGEVEQYRRGHKAYDQLVTYVQKAGLSTEEVNTGFNIMRLMKHDPQQALEALMPFVSQLQQASGEILPADLVERVQLGEIDEQSAREMARLRARGQILESQHARSAQSFEQQQRDGLADAVGAATSAWEQRWKASDPDYAALQPYVQREIELRLRRGEIPQNPQQAEHMCGQILEQVRQELSKFRPRPQAIRPPTGGAVPTNLPKPTSMLEAMKQAIGR